MFCYCLRSISKYIIICAFLLGRVWCLQMQERLDCRSGGLSNRSGVTVTGAFFWRECSNMINYLHHHFIIQIILSLCIPVQFVVLMLASRAKYTFFVSYHPTGLTA